MAQDVSPAIAGDNVGRCVVISAALDSVMHPWDTAAIIPCIRESGGFVSTVQGDYQNVVSGGSLLTSCSRRLHEEILEIIGEEVCL